MGLIRRTVDRWLARSTPSLSLNEYLQYFTYGGLAYGLTGQTTLGGKQEEPAATFAGYAQAAYKQNGVVYACTAARLRLFSEARFQFRQLRSGRPGDLFGTTELAILERPWQGGTTGDLLARAEQCVTVGGNFFVARNGPELYWMRPDWVTIIIGSQSDPDDGANALDARVIGYAYQPGGPAARKDPVILLPEQVAHYAPTPDPQTRFRGMSWLTPVIREIMADSAAMEHKLKFFENGATPNLMISMKGITKDDFEFWVKKLRADHDGVANAYKTLYLMEGADAKPIGTDLKQLDFKITQGHGETRLAAAAEVPPIIVGLSEGLEAATYSNYALAMRRFADLTMRPLWRNMAGSLSNIIRVPDGAELWYDDRDIPALKEDIKIGAEVQQMEAQTMRTLIESGYKPDSVTDAVVAGDLSRLEHTGLTSVQLQEPGMAEDEPSQNGAVPDMAPAE